MYNEYIFKYVVYLKIQLLEEVIHWFFVRLNIIFIEIISYHCIFSYIQININTCDQGEVIYKSKKKEQIKWDMEKIEGNQNMPAPILIVQFNDTVFQAHFVWQAKLLLRSAAGLHY